MRALVLAALTSFLLSGCAAAGFFTPIETFDTNEHLELAEPRRGVLDVVAAVGKDLGYSVTSLDRAAGMIGLTSETSRALTFLVGKAGSVNLNITTSGKTVTIHLWAIGNFGAASQDAATKLLTEFKGKLVAALGPAAFATAKTTGEPSAPAAATPKPSCPAPGTVVPLAKVMNPAFVRDFEGCDVVVEAIFLRVSTGPALPNYDVVANATFQIVDPGTNEQPGRFGALAGTPKAQASLLFELKVGEPIQLRGAPRAIFVQGRFIDAVFHAESVSKP